MSELVERLREESADRDRVAWGRSDGGQEWTLSAMLADQAADRIEALEAVLREAREVIVALVDSRWSEVESTGAEEVAFIDAALKQD